MLRRVWETFFRKHVVAEVPAEMAACLDCNAGQCLNDGYQTCPVRLGETAAPGAARTSGPA
jgi:hypothetical protein